MNETQNPTPHPQRFGPDSAKVYTQHACTLGSIILTFLGTSIAVGNFEVF